MRPASLKNCQTSTMKPLELRREDIYAALLIGVNNAIIFLVEKLIKTVKSAKSPGAIQQRFVGDTLLGYPVGSGVGNHYEKF